MEVWRFSFPGTKSHRLSWPTARRNYISEAIIAFDNGTGNTGLLYYLLEYQEFTTLAYKIHPTYDDEEEREKQGEHKDGFKTFSPCKRPNWDTFYSADADGNRTYDGATYKHFLAIWDKQETTLQKFTANFLDTLDEVTLGAIGPPDARMIMSPTQYVPRLGHPLRVHHHRRAQKRKGEIESLNDNPSKVRLLAGNLCLNSPTPRRQQYPHQAETFSIIKSA